MSDIYHQELLELFQQPSYKQLLEDPTHQAESTNASCGDDVRVTVSVVDGRIEAIGWGGHGCVISQAATDMLADYLVSEKLSVERTLAITDKDLLALLQLPNLSPGRYTCATLGLRSIKEALESQP